MNYTECFLGADATVKASNSKDVAGAVSSIARAAGDIFSSFFQYKSDKLQQTDPNRTPATVTTPQGMDKGTKTALLVGGGVAAAALLLVVAMK